MLFCYFSMILMQLPLVFSRGGGGVRGGGNDEWAGIPVFAWIIIFVFGSACIYCCVWTPYCCWVLSKNEFVVNELEGHVFHGEDGIDYINDGTGEYYDESGLKKIVTDKRHDLYYSPSPFTSKFYPNGVSAGDMKDVLPAGIITHGGAVKVIFSFDSFLLSSY